MLDYDEMTDARRRDLCAQAQRAYKRRRIYAVVRRWGKVRHVPLEAKWAHRAIYQGQSGTPELHGTIPVQRLPWGTREIVVVFEDL